MELNLHLQLPSGPVAVARARDFVSDLRGHVPEGVFDDVRLLVSELVTNCVLHGGDRLSQGVVVRITLGSDTVRVDVRDGGPGFERFQPSLVDGQTSGWGLYMVDQLASRWGVSHEDDLFAVWFELDGPGGRQTPGLGHRAA